MEKTTTMGIAIVIVIVIAIGAYFVYNDKGLGNVLGNTTSIVVKTNATTSTNNVTTTKTTISTVQSTVQTTTQQNASLSNCVSGSPTASIYNGNFGSGTYAGWNTSGNGFGTTPANITTYNNDNEYYNSPWSNYDGSYFATTYKGGFVISPGNLTSNIFKVTEPYLNFQMVSPQSNQLYVEILSNGVPVITKQFDTFGSSGSPSGTFENVSISLTTLLCQNISIKVVSGIAYTPATKYEVLAVGDFYLSKTPVQSSVVVES